MHHHSQEESQYRDRAKERRLDTNEDLTNQYAHLDAEQSKFLGGDIEHTHLVRGLDFALLQKTKVHCPPSTRSSLHTAFMVVLPSR